MLRRTRLHCDLHTTTTSSPSWRAPPMQNLMGAVVQSPYKDSFKEYWATPVPWAPRDYGPKPKIGDAIPMRQAASTLLVAKNNHMDPTRVATGEDNDYKVCMMFREPMGRYTKDQFVLPSAPVTLADRDEDWGPLLVRLGVKTPHSDMTLRLAALRALLVEFNMLVLPPEGGGLAEVEGPPGGKKWHLMIMSQPALMRQFVDILELPLENSLNSLRPFLRIQTPNTEQFRFDSTAYVVTFPKMPCVKYTISTVGEELFWVSPKEALARYEAGVMELPTPTVVLMNELDKNFPKFDDVQRKLTMDTEPRIVTPEIVHDPETRMATVLLPGDIHHSATPALREEMLVKRKQKKEKQTVKAMNLGAAEPSTDPLSAIAAAEAKGGKTAKKKKTKQQGQQQQQDATASAATADVDEDEDDQDMPPDLFYRIQYEKDEPYGVKSVLCYRPVIPGVDNTMKMPQMEERLITADAPQLMTLESMKQEEIEYITSQTARNESGTGSNQPSKLAMENPEVEREASQKLRDMVTGRTGEYNRIPPGMFSGGESVRVNPGPPSTTTDDDDDDGSSGK